MLQNKISHKKPPSSELSDEGGTISISERITDYCLSLIAACAAASLAIGTRKGEQET